ncbi:efflux RND transporter periplasmic adaptor subunit [Billgrantia azerbaijanica]|nr:efflux RND transporter periplasmic adaptor subunit [Halomonas azerbaijanica]
MNPMGKYLLVTSLGVLLGVLLGVSGSVVLDGKTFILGRLETVIGNGGGQTGEEGEKEPLYWVAPMDPNYKRDKPGKSPMGMDLIPVYEERSEGDSPGTVTISPDVVNNLGVRTATVERDTFDTTVRTVGYVQYDEDSLVHIHPRVEGWIEQLFVKAEGDRVTQGEPLYSIYSPTLVNAQEELLLAINRDNPRLISAAMERLRALQVPDAAIERLRQTRQVSQTITLRAPQSGVLDNLEVREGMFVRPGMSMMSIGVLDRVWVVGEVFERQAALIAEGDAVRMTLDYLPERQWEGTVDYIYPNIDGKTRTARVRIRFANEDLALKPGMFAQLTMLSVPKEKTLQIPREALIRTGSQSRVVLALGDGKFKSIAVHAGRVGRESVEILSGLEEGERIVTSAQFLIDSESSKTSDFQRMAHDRDGPADEPTEPASAWVAARIETLMPGHRMITLAHESIDAWQWPAMTMDFTVDQAVDMNPLKPGMNLHVQIHRGDGENYSVGQVHIPDGGTTVVEPELPRSMDHDGAPTDPNQHQGMNHDAMAMDHSQHQGMNHDAMVMDHSQHGQEDGQ